LIVLSIILKYLTSDLPYQVPGSEIFWVGKKKNQKF
jgi:hypothetical protein